MSRTAKSRVVACERCKSAGVHSETVYEIRCDKCNLLIFEDLDEYDPEASAQELVIRLNQDQCVNFYRLRDYCPDCLEDIWLGINELIGVKTDNAWDERDREYSLDEYR